MRIALITPGFSADDDDWCIPVLQNLAGSLQKNHQVQVITISYPHHSSRYTVKGIPVRSFGTKSQSAYAYIQRMIRAHRYLKSAHARRSFDVLHGFWTDQGGLLASMTGRVIEVPAVVTSMAGELTYSPEIGYGRRKQPIAGRVAKFGAGGKSLLTVGSEFNRQRLFVEQPDLNSTIVALGVDTALFSPSGTVADLKGNIKLLMVGSLVAVKGHATGLRALASAVRRRPGLHLHIVGDGPLRQHLETLTEELDISSCVSFHGHVVHDRLPLYYRAADLCLLPSYFESTAMVILEAGACQRPTIGSAVGLLSEIAPPMNCLAVGDVEVLAARIVQLSNSPRELKNIGQSTAIAVARNFSLQHMTSRFEEIYKESIAVFKH